jgi:hypothetical protein
MLNLKKKLRKQLNNSKSLLFLLLIFFNSNNLLLADTSWLITPNEYLLLGAGVSDNVELLSNNDSNGPIIVLSKPKITDEVLAPVNITINFLPGKSDALPNMESLVVSLKGLITIDITNRIKPYINGNTLEITDAKIPKGKHKILFMIQDNEENYSERLIKFKVS